MHRTATPRVPLLIVFLSILGTAACAGGSTVEPADVVIRGGAIYTVEESQPWARGIAITNNRIVAVVDTDQETEAYIDESTRVVELGGRLALPGFIDAHSHFQGFAAQQHDIMLMNVDSNEGLADEVARIVDIVGPGEWITGGDWAGAIQWMEGLGEIEAASTDRWEPDRATIDDITADNPALLTSYDGELFLANTAALRAAGLEDTLLDGMKVENDRATGLLYAGSPAIDRIREVIKPKSEERILNEYREGLRLHAEMGIVEIHDMFRGFEQIERYVTLQENGELTARIWARPWLDLSEEMFSRGLSMGDHPVTGERDYFLRFGGFKSANDGMLGSRGAMLFEPYADRPDYSGHYQEYNSDSDTFGSLVGNPEVYYDFVRDAVEHGFAVDSHTIGDRGISEAIDVLERIAADLDADMSMFRLIHAEVVQPREFDRIKALNLIVETNPSQLPDDMRWLRERLGPEREKLAFPFRTFIDEGIVMNFGSDVPGNAGAIFFNHPRYVLNAAVHRTNNEGEPAGGWQPHHKISMEEAIRSFTLNGAYATMREDEIRGSIAVGKLADVVIVDRNIIEEPGDVLSMEIDMTIVDGRVVFER
ncbi:MAG: amidohydrolase family protein [Acidobacteria bacterium]|nr:amidohydrolase family protein [Acidobacteriota bacterium]